MNDTPRSRLLLLELVCDLILFVLCAVVCVALLVQARGMSRRSTELTQAVYLAQEAAEQFQSTGEWPRRYFDAHWNEVDGVPYTYVLVTSDKNVPLSDRPDAAMETVEVSIYSTVRGNDLNYALMVSRPREVASHG